MTVSDLRKAYWTTIDWNDIPKTTVGSFKQRYINEEDIKNFITDKTKELARTANINYDELEKLIRDENEAFFSFMNSLFEKYDALLPTSYDVQNLQRFLKFPTIPYKSYNPVISILNDFDRLTDTQKLEVLTKLKLISVKITQNSNTEGVRELI